MISINSPWETWWCYTLDAEGRLLSYSDWILFSSHLESASIFLNKLFKVYSNDFNKFTLKTSRHPLWIVTEKWFPIISFPVHRLKSTGLQLQHVIGPFTVLYSITHSLTSYTLTLPSHNLLFIVQNLLVYNFIMLLVHSLFCIPSPILTCSTLTLPSHNLLFF